MGAWVRGLKLIFLTDFFEWNRVKSGFEVLAEFKARAPEYETTAAGCGRGLDLLGVVRVLLANISTNPKLGQNENLAIPPTFSALRFDRAIISPIGVPQPLLAFRWSK
jgi:hypothetical protein